MLNEIKESDFNYYIDKDNKYVFYFLGYGGEILKIKDYAVKVDPIETMKTLTIQGLRYNPLLKYHK